jgi:outer membrane protein assembly factor BamA
MVHQLQIRFLPISLETLEFSTEYRAKIYDIVKGALFVDAGNIWLLKTTLINPSAVL